MDAKRLTPLQEKFTVRAIVNKKKPGSKTVLMNPFDVTWPLIEKDVQKLILDKITSTIKPLRIAKEKNSKQRKTEAESSVTQETSQDKAKIRKQLLIGVNEVTKGLENDDVRLVVTCQSAQPPIITKHLLCLSATRECPALRIDGLSETVCSIMNLKSAVAVGFKKIAGDDPHVFDELVKFIIEKAVKIELPWLVQETSVVSESSENVVKEEGSETQCLLSGPASGNITSDDEHHQDVPMETNGFNTNFQGHTEQSSVDTSKAETLTPKVESKVKDISCFYVYKKDSKKKKGFTGDFIAFSHDNVKEEMLSGQAVVTETKVHYKKAKIQLVPQNFNKQKKQKKKLKTKIR